MNPGEVRESCEMATPSQSFPFIREYSDRRIRRVSSCGSARPKSIPFFKLYPTSRRSGLPVNGFWNWWLTLFILTAPLSRKRSNKPSQKRASTHAGWMYSPLICGKIPLCRSIMRGSWPSWRNRIARERPEVPAPAMTIRCLSAVIA